LSHTQPALKILRQKWFLAATFGWVLWFSFYLWLLTWWQEPYPLRWLLISAGAMGYLLWVLWRGLPDNHRQDEIELLPSFGLGNLLSIVRGYVMVLFCGFLFSPWPDQGWTAWLPGLLYTLAALPDFVDGVAARLTNHVTQLGDTLDMSIDSLGVLSVSIIAVQYNQIPWWYLFVSLARYIFLAGIWLRQKRKLSVYNLEYSVRRRGYAALGMGLFFVVLYPVFTPPGTHIVAGIFAIYILGSFLWDWLVTIGWLPAELGKRYQMLESVIVGYVPLFLRLSLLLWGVMIFLPGSLVQVGSPLFWVLAGAVLCLIMGVAGRISAIIALLTFGLCQTIPQLESDQVLFLVLCTNILFLGTGKYSLWPVEDRLIYHRIGDPQ
jgi:CDP-diacylglycerol--glycerol-3-phosphate 3-phosphatidyltransferase